MSRRLVGLVTAVVTVAGAIWVPILDASAPLTTPVVEAHHEPGRCHVHHDHLACVQHHASAAHPTPPNPAAPDPDLREQKPEVADATPVARTSSELHLPRAPPLPTLS